MFLVSSGKAMKPANLNLRVKIKYRKQLTILNRKRAGEIFFT